MFHSSYGNDVIHWPIDVLYPYKGHLFRAANSNVLYTTHAGEFRPAGSAAATSKFQLRFGTYLALEKIQV